MGLQIPQYDQPKVRQAGLPGTGSSAQAPDGLGALSGSLMEAAKTLKASQDHADKVRVDGADAEAMAVWSAAKLKLAALEGENALDEKQVSAIHKEAEDNVRAIGSKLSTDAQREMFNQITTRRRTEYQTYAGDHQLKQFKVVEKTNADNREFGVIENGRTSAEAADAVGIVSARAELQDALDTKMRANGFTDPNSPTYKAEMLKSTSRFHAGVVEGFLASKEPGKAVLAKEYLAAARDEIDGKVYDALSKRLEVEASGHEGLLAYEAAAAAHPDDEVEQQKFLREMVKSGKLNDKGYAAAESEMDRSRTVKHATKLASQKKHEDSVWEVANSHGYGAAINSLQMQRYAVEDASEAGKLKEHFLRLQRFLDEKDSLEDNIDLRATMMDWAKNGIPAFDSSGRPVMEGSKQRRVRIEDLTKDQVAAQAKKLGKLGTQLVTYWGSSQSDSELKMDAHEIEQVARNTKIVKGDKPTKEEQAIMWGAYEQLRSDYGVNNKLKPAERQAMLALYMTKVFSGEMQWLGMKQEHVPLFQMLQRIPPSWQKEWRDQNRTGSLKDMVEAWAEARDSHKIDKNGKPIVKGK